MSFNKRLESISFITHLHSRFVLKPPCLTALPLLAHYWRETNAKQGSSHLKHCSIVLLELSKNYTGGLVSVHWGLCSLTFFKALPPLQVVYPSGWRGALSKNSSPIPWCCSITCTLDGGIWKRWGDTVKKTSQLAKRCWDSWSLNKQDALSTV